MLLRVYVDPRRISTPGSSGSGSRQSDRAEAAEGQRVFQTTACVNCHAVAGTIGTGVFGPDLTHLMSRDTIASGILPNTRDNLRAWISDPDTQAWLAHAGHAADRQGAGRAHGVSADAAMTDETFDVH